MTTDSDNPLNITDEDSGKEAKPLIDGEPLGADGQVVWANSTKKVGT